MVQFGSDAPVLAYVGQANLLDDLTNTEYGGNKYKKGTEVLLLQTYFNGCQVARKSSNVHYNSVVSINLYLYL